MTITIIASLEEGSEQWDAVQLGLRIKEQTSVGMLYKRYNELNTAINKIDTEERWSDLRFLIISHASVLQAIDPEAGTMSAVSAELQRVKDKFAFKRYELVIIGVSTNDMFGQSLMRSGCDTTCSGEALPELILELLQPRSGRIKLPDDL